MEKFKSYNSIDEILDMAIKMEEGSYNFYMDLAKKAQSKGSKEKFIEFANEEVKHKELLEKIKADKSIVVSSEIVANLKISSYLTMSHTEGGEMSYQDSLILAMKREKAAYMLYTKLAGKVEKGNVRDVLLMLAQEEAKHKLQYEIEYDELVYKEN